VLAGVIGGPGWFIMDGDGEGSGKMIRQGWERTIRKCRGGGLVRVLEELQWVGGGGGVGGFGWGVGGGVLVGFLQAPAKRTGGFRDLKTKGGGIERQKESPK